MNTTPAGTTITRLSGFVTLTKLDGDWWAAHITDEPNRKDKGMSQGEAVGNLVMTHPERFGVNKSEAAK